MAKEKKGGYKGTMLVSCSGGGSVVVNKVCGTGMAVLGM